MEHENAILESKTGTVKWFDALKGYGFIVGPEDQDIFVHYTVIEVNGFKTLKDGASVIYNAELGPKGWSASKVSRIHSNTTRFVTK